MSEDPKPKRKYTKRVKAETPTPVVDSKVIDELIRDEIEQAFVDGTAFKDTPYVPVPKVSVREVEESYVEVQNIPEATPKEIVGETEPMKRIKELLPREPAQNIRRALNVVKQGGTVGVSTTKGLIVIPTLSPHRGGITKLERMPNVVYIVGK